MSQSLANDPFHRNDKLKGCHCMACDDIGIQKPIQKGTMVKCQHCSKWGIPPCSYVPKYVEVLQPIATIRVGDKYYSVEQARVLRDQLNGALDSLGERR